MKTNLIYGLRAAIGYALLIGAIILIMIMIKNLIGGDINQYFTPIYYITIIGGFVVTFVSGCLYPFFINRSINSYASKYPDVPIRYIEEICRWKVWCRYCAILSCLCLVLSLFYSMEKYSLIVCALNGGCFVFLFQFLRYRKKHKDL